MPQFKTKDGKVINFSSKKDVKPSGILGYQTKGADDAKRVNTKA